ncbi:MAG: endonuclease III [Candidatus Omnitrophica bacterium]|nr:endonuclease III [Candidatus Omnitrophota bacterium]
MDKKTADRMYRILHTRYPGPQTALKHKNPVELLVATILSAQCTDERVNIVTKELFKKYRTAEDYAGASIPVFENEIRSTGFYRNKARNIIAMAGIIKDEFGGSVPDMMDELLRLPGVARKTANIILFHAFGKNEGIAVDTHVKRVSGKLGLTNNTDPVKIEQDLMRLFDRSRWGILSNLLIEHGRKVCNARRPMCPDCPLNKLCPSAGSH